MRARIKIKTVAVLGGTALAASMLMPGPGVSASPSTNTITGRVSVLPGPVEPAKTGDSTLPEVSGDGRYVAFESTAVLTSIDTGGINNVYVRDLVTDQIELVSVSADGKAGPGGRLGDISADGRYVAFSSDASNIVAGDTNGFIKDVFVRDRKTRTTVLASKNSSGTQVSTDTPAFGRPRLSSNGRTVIFDSRAPQLLNPTSTTFHVYARDLDLNFTERVTQSTAGVLANANSFNADVSGDGRYVVFSSLATNLATDTNGARRDVFRRDRTTDTTTLISFTSSGTQANADSDWPSISNDGNKVAFNGDGAMTADDTATVGDVFVRNVSAATTTKISTRLGGGEADQGGRVPAISGDGSTVTWTSSAGEYVAGGGNGQVHVFKRVGTAPITRESLTSAGAMGNSGSYDSSLSTDGKVLVFESTATNLTTGDTGKKDIFVRRAPEVGPHGTTAAYASAMVEHFTGAPNTAAANAMAARIAIGSSPDREVLALAHAPAFAGKRAPLVRLYVAYFKRLPDTSGLAYWLKKLNAGAKLDQVSAKFAASSEFKTKYGNTTNTQFVTLVYQNVLNRDPEASGLAYWVKKLDGGMSRGTVMTNFSESSEGQRKFRPQVDTALVSLGLLGKIGPGNLMKVVTDYMTADSSERGVQRLVFSAEYAAAV